MCYHWPRTELPAHDDYKQINFRRFYCCFKVLHDALYRLLGQAALSLPCTPLLGEPRNGYELRTRRPAGQVSNEQD